MASAFDIAAYIINSIEVDNLKLQKLVYYSQAVHLVLHNKTPLFPDTIEAWQYGPVIPALYQKYKQYGFDPISRSGGKSNLNADEFESVDLVLEYYGKMSGVELINRTHQEKPWHDVYKPRENNIISTDSIYNFYKERFHFIDE